MSKQKTEPKVKAPATVAKQPGELAAQYFDKYAAAHQDRLNSIIHYICIPLLALGLFGMAWAVPFPQLKFLGVYGAYFNWASFLIALAIYYYLKLSPVISYLMLFVLMCFSYIIMELLKWQASGGPAMWLVCAVLFIASFAVLLAGNKRESTFAVNGYNIKSIAIAPAYQLNLLLKKLGIKL